MQIFGLTLDTLGVLMISYMALRVHHRVREEHKIDSDVFREMRTEQVLGLTGIVFIIIGYTVQVLPLLGY